MKIVAFDPGHTTGVALYDSHDPDYNAIADVSKKDYLEATWQKHYETTEAEGINTLWDVLHMGAPYDRVIYESFLYQRRDKVDLRPVEAIGVIKLYCILNDLVPIAQTPAHGKAFWKDDKIKKLDLWEPGKVHAMDAMRHLLYYQAFQLKETRLLERLKG